MKKAYWIAKYKKIDDQDALGRYAEKAKKIIEAFGGKALVRGGKYVTFEGENFIRTVIWEFENIDLLSFPQELGGGLAVWHPRGAIVRD